MRDCDLSRPEAEDGKRLCDPVQLRHIHQMSWICGEKSEMSSTAVEGEHADKNSKRYKGGLHEVSKAACCRIRNEEVRVPM